MRWWMGLCLGLVLCTASLSYSDDRRPGDYRHRKEYQVIPEPQRPGDRVIIRRGRKCEVVCTRLWDGTTRCEEYKC